MPTLISWFLLLVLCTNPIRRIHCGLLAFKVGDAGIDMKKSKMLKVVTSVAQTLNQLADAYPDFIINNILQMLGIVDEATVS